ncbi:MAG: transposase [Endomicrobiales bacterium]
MPRHTRIHAPGAAYHIIARGGSGRKIYLNDNDRRQFLSLIKSTRLKYPFTLYSYVLMSDHFHLLVEVGEKTTSRIMQSLLTSYSRYFNHAHKRHGHLFRGRYKAFLCEKDAHLLELLRCLHLNPLRAKQAGTPDAWEWSSHNEYSGQKRAGLIDAGIIGGLFGKGEAGYRKYRQFMAGGSVHGIKGKLYPGESNPFPGPATEMREQAGDARHERAGRHSLEELAGRIAKKNGLSKELLLRKTKQRDISRMRKNFIDESVRGGFRQSEIARYLGCDQSYVSRNAQKSG